MRFVHTFWSKPLLKGKFNKYSELLPVIISDYAYSAACVQKYGHQIKLFTDKKGAKLLSCIPYDNVIIVDELENESVDFAAQIKFIALKQMELDECLIDGDLFLRNKIIFDILQSISTDVLYSFYEPVEYTIGEKHERESYYDKIKSVLNKYRDEIEPIYSNKTGFEFTWPNTSFMRFDNQKLKDEYIRQYYYHKSIFEKEEFGNSWPDIWIEQKHLDKLLNSGYTGRPIVYGFPTRAANDYAAMLGFVHLGGGKVKYKNYVFNWLKDINYSLYLEVIKQIDKYRKGIK